ncbi:uncharacterized protein LOC121371622 [Gigantopelta aegis]|uniref:uncharacterized protein LOC121371622 n=1 Tax=Gigantopelta aegis TaxID=1735272 RepID=UPI001B88870B|nr:uncharacterized protein LOC121371622 [Gigantopelta aegis]XP_041353582.1 uncharacterized protein LOC121371622 [Gigantopelta aegis]
MAGYPAVELVKNTLKTAILSKRQARGEGTIKVEFKETPSQELTPDDLLRRQRRREQNRDAARRFRIKKRNSNTLNQTTYNKYWLKNTGLQTEIKQLQEEKKKLEEILKTHVNSCMCVYHTQPRQHQQRLHYKQRDMMCNTEYNRTDAIVPVFDNTQHHIRHCENTNMTCMANFNAAEAIAPVSGNKQHQIRHCENTDMTCMANSYKKEDDTAPVTGNRQRTLVRQFSIPSDALTNLENLLGARDVNASSFLPFGSYSDLLECTESDQDANPPTPISGGFEVVSSANSTQEKSIFFGDDFELSDTQVKRCGRSVKVETVEMTETEEQVPDVSIIRRGPNFNNNDGLPLPNFEQLLYPDDC